MIDAAGTLSTGEALFAGAMGGFYNDDLCAKVYNAAGFSDTRGVRLFAARLDPERVEVLTKLMLNYRGW